MSPYASPNRTTFLLDVKLGNPQLGNPEHYLYCSIEGKIESELKKERWDFEVITPLGGRLTTTAPRYAVNSNNRLQAQSSKLLSFLLKKKVDDTEET